MNQGLMHPLAASSFPNLLRLVAAYGCEAKYCPRLLYLMLMTFVRQPLMWATSARYARRITRQPIEPAPIFILGHWRSGTTHLQNLMSEDPQFGRVTLLQAAMPHEFLMLSDGMKKRLDGMMPSKRLMDNVPVAADIPWEEELALTAVGRMSFYHVSFFPKSMRRIFRDAVMFDGGKPELIELWKKQYVNFLRKVQFVQPGKCLLLKNPANTARLTQVRDMFPGARFIHLHRNPYKVFTSSVHLYSKAQEAWGLQDTSRQMVVEHVLESYPQLMNAYFEQRNGLTHDELVEVGFRSVQENPIGALSKIYSTLNIPGFDEAVPHFDAYLESQRNYKKNKLPLSEDEKQVVAARWGEIFERLGYPL